MTTADQKKFKKHSRQLAGEPAKEALCRLCYNGEEIPHAKHDSYKNLIELKRYLWFNSKRTYPDLLKFEILPLGEKSKLIKI